MSGRVCGTCGGRSIMKNGDCLQGIWKYMLGEPITEEQRRLIQA